MMHGCEFSVVTGDVVERILREDPGAIVAAVSRAYLAHEASEAVSLPSQFLRFADTPDARIISLAGSLDYGSPVSGIKWIGSYPGNVAAGLPRASAVLVLNRRDTGQPFALLEGSVISASRTAAAAVLAAERIGRLPSRSCTLGIVGCGLIARHTLDMLTRTGWSFEQVLVHDASAESAQRFADRAAESIQAPVRVAAVESLLASSRLILFTTTAVKPHIDDPKLFQRDATVLHMSLRDLSPEVILACANLVDDVDHCLRASTSVHLAEQAVQHRRFLVGTIGQLLRGELTLPDDRPIVLSPFGLATLDIAVGRYVYEQAVSRGLAHRIDGFFPALMH